MKKGEKGDAKQLSAPAIRVLPDSDREAAKGDARAKPSQPGSQRDAQLRC